MKKSEHLKLKLFEQLKKELPDDVVKVVITFTSHGTFTDVETISDHKTSKPFIITKNLKGKDIR